MSFSAELKAIAKAFGACRANSGVDLSIRAGTIHALIGENGAGKSTAMKILFGAIKPDSGSIQIGDEVVSDSASWGPEQAFKRGIGMVYQHFMLAGPETVHDNLVLGAELTRFGLLRDRAEERRRLEALMRSTGLVVPLDRPVEELAIGLQSRCEILKVLYRQARFLILDEPTAVLTPQEISDFLAILVRLRSQGKTILIVTHKLKEVMAVADDVTVLRAGQTVATRKVSETSIEELSELMVGRRLQLPKAKKQESSARGEVLARIALGAAKLELTAGTVTGIAGVEGNGQEALVSALIDPSQTAKGNKLELELFGKPATTFGAGEIRKLPIAIIPADRHHEGLVLSFPLFENLRLGRKQAGRRGYFGSAQSDERELLSGYDVRPNDPQIAARALSGGNQQKVIVARELGDLPARSIVLAVHPTRGVDLGAIEFIHGKLLAAAASGAAVLLISSELDELMALSHRIGVMYRGALVEWFEGPPYDEKPIGLAMLSGRSS